MRVDAYTLNRLQTIVWPALESGYDLPGGLLNAISNWETRGTFENGSISSSGARGIFQLTPIALKQIKIDSGSSIDPSNVYSASVGAALLLTRFHRLFSGQTPLMVAAYNAGEGTVKKFIRDTAATGQGFLPNETKMYILNVVPMVS